MVDKGKYTWQDDTYRYDVVLPNFLSTGGHIGMARLDNTEAYNVDLAISRWENKKYVFHIFIIDEGDIGYFIVDTNLNLYGNYSESEMREKEDMLEDYREEIQKIVNDAISMWPFIK